MAARQCRLVAALLLCAAMAPRVAAKRRQDVAPPPVIDAAAAAPTRRPIKLPLAAGAAGIAFGEAITPKITDPLAGGVGTAEAWRRKIKARRPVPLAERAPPILAYGIACATLTEYILGFEEHGAVGSLLETRAVRASRTVGRRVAARLEPTYRKRLEPTLLRCAPYAASAVALCQERADAASRQVSAMASAAAQQIADLKQRSSSSSS